MSRLYRALDGYGTERTAGVPAPALSRWRICERCDVRWAGDADCWICGKPGVPMYADLTQQQQQGKPLRG